MPTHIQGVVPSARGRCLSREHARSGIRTAMLGGLRLQQEMGTMGVVVVILSTKQVLAGLQQVVMRGV